MCLQEAKEILLAKVDAIEPQQYVRKLAEDQIQKLSDHPTSGEHKTPGLIILLSRSFPPL